MTKEDPISSVAIIGFGAACIGLCLFVVTSVFYPIIGLRIITASLIIGGITVGIMMPVLNAANGGEA